MSQLTLTAAPAAIAALLLMAQAASAEVPSTQRQYLLERAGDRYQLALKTVPIPALGANDVLLKVRAVSLNRRDVYALTPSPRGDASGQGIVSDGAGEVVAVGSAVTRFKVGDRVVGTFDSVWIDGASSGYLPRNGMLAEYAISPETTLLPIPAYLSFEEAATLPCAAVTAWNTLFKAAQVKPGDYVLLEGTGGVSIFGLQLAVAAGAKPIITSSSDDKLRRARELGAVGTVNYRTVPEWQHEVLKLTGNKGVQHVLEVGGKDTLPRAIASLAPGGHIGLIGGLSEGGFVRERPEERLKERNARLSNIYVGSRTDFEQMNAYFEQHKIKTIIDKVYDYEAAPAAFEQMQSGAFFGKIVIRVGK
ncbi:MAG: NAD(P)-dependent alcohol dehydrogenase [Gammaproteobacteria bacterium]|nr:NAD(P)-dependent alcohol dehydrogenase [Gammaproteobacteria bacterium]